MFHKEGSTSDSGNKSSESTLRKSDLRRLKSDFVTQFRVPDDERHLKVVDQLFDRIYVRKLRRLNVSIYFRDSNEKDSNTDDCSWPYQDTNQPILIDLDLKQSAQSNQRNSCSWAPALPLLHFWMNHASPSYHDLIPNVIVHAPVSKFVCRGADLMKSGIVALTFRDYDVSTGNHFKLGRFVCVSVLGNPLPFAVGKVISENLITNFGPGTKGVGVCIVSSYGDDLWRTSFNITKNSSRQLSNTSDDLHCFGNEGFLDGEIVMPYMLLGDERVEENVEQSSSSHNTNISNINNTDDSAAGEFAIKLDECKEEGKEIQTCNDISNNVSEKSNADEQDDASENSVNHDDLLFTAFLYSLNNSVKDKALPIPVSSFYAGHIIPAVRKLGDEVLDIKKTKHKKISTFLLEQASKGVISLAPSKDTRDSVAFLTGVNRAHAKLRELKKAMKSLSLNDDSKSKLSSNRKIVVVNLFLVPQKLAMTMNLDKDIVSAKNAKTVERKGTGFLTVSESREVLDLYISNNNLVDQSSSRYVCIDGPLGDALWGLTKKERQAVSSSKDFTSLNRPERIDRKKLQERWQSKLERGYAIVRMPGSKIISLKRGSPPKISIEVEKRQGNKKFTTRVRGLEEYDFISEQFANDVSKRFACAASADSNAENRAALKKGHMEVSIQGHLVNEIQALLTGNDKFSSHGGAKGGTYCLPPETLEVTLRKGVSKKKKV